MKAFTWLSFDLGVRGDYEGMYEFLDAHEAKECGDSMGAFWYEYKKDLIGGKHSVNQLEIAVSPVFARRARLQKRVNRMFTIGELLKELKEVVVFDKRSRVYLIYPGKKGIHMGKYIIGRRKAPPWSGYGPSRVEEEDVSE